MSGDIGFNVCRVCLAPEKVFGSSSLFEQTGGRAERFREMSGVDISKDKGKHEAIICKTCLHEVERAYHLKQLIADADQHYFEKKRQQYEERQLIEFVSVEHVDNFDVGTEHTEKSIVDFENKILTESDRFGNQMLTVHTYKDLLPKSITSDHAKDQEISLRTIDDISLVDVLNEENDGADVTKKTIKSIEKEKKKFKCKICNKFLSSKNYLDVHIKSFHKKIKRFACDKCPMKFYRKYNFGRHIENHLKNPNFKPHIINTADSSRRFKCNVVNCGKYFFNERNLQNHKASHSDARPFVCWCGKAFKFRFNFNAHQRNVHG